MVEIRRRRRPPESHGRLPTRQPPPRLVDVQPGLPKHCITILHTPVVPQKNQMTRLRRWHRLQVVRNRSHAEWAAIKARVAAEADVAIKEVVSVGGGAFAGRARRAGGLVEIFEPGSGPRPIP